MLNAPSAMATVTLPVHQPISPVSAIGHARDLTTLERVRDVAENPDRVIRNLQITQSYHEFSLAFDPFLGYTDGPWCVFATWVSKQVGYFIRNEEVPAPLRQFLGLDSQQRFGLLPLSDLLLSTSILSYIRLTVDDISQALGEGNRLVYANLGALFADFLKLLQSHDRPDPMKLEAFLNRWSHDPINGDEINRAFTHFYHAVFETDPKIKAERVFMTNMLIGLHEQVRLQEALDNAFTAPIRRALDDPKSEPLPSIVRVADIELLKRLQEPLLEQLEDALSRVITELFLSIITPNGELDTSEDMPPLPNGDMYPDALKTLTLPEAQALVEELDYTPGTSRGSGARDWTQLGDRMNYVVDLFRSRQQERTLLQAPFTPEQTDAIRAGRLPAGPL